MSSPEQAPQPLPKEIPPAALRSAEATGMDPSHFGPDGLSRVDDRELGHRIAIETDRGETSLVEARRDVRAHEATVRELGKAGLMGSVEGLLARGSAIAAGGLVNRLQDTVLRQDLKARDEYRRENGSSRAA